MEWTKAVLKAAQEENAPVIPQTSEGRQVYADSRRLRTWSDIMDTTMKITVPVVIIWITAPMTLLQMHRSRLFIHHVRDGSALPIEENIAKTKRTRRCLRRKGMSLAEVGAIGGEEDGVVGMGECADRMNVRRLLISALRCWRQESANIQRYIGKLVRTSL